MLALVLAMVSAAALDPVAPRSGATPSREDVRCFLVLSIDTTFWERWEYSSEPGPHLPRAEHVVRGERFAPHVFVQNPGIDGDGMARLRQDLRILRPDGTVYFEELDSDAYSGPFQSGNLLRTSTFLEVRLEPEDPLGRYRVEATLRDLVAGTTGTCSSELELVEYEEGDGFSSIEDLEQWFSRYRGDPQPTRIIPAILCAARDGWSGERTSLHGALRDLVGANLWLIPELLGRLDGADDATRRWILWIVSRQLQVGVEPPADLRDADQEVWNDFAAAHDPLFDPVQGREDINELSGMFWPRRSSEPLLRVCSLLAGEETGAVADIRLTHPDVPDGVPLWMVVDDVAAETLTRWMEWDWDPIARDYCRAIQLSEGLSPGVRRALDGLLETGDGSSKR